MTLRVAHLTTVDMSLALLLATELDEDLRAGHEVYGISTSGPYVERVESLGVRHVPVESFTRSWNLRSDVRAFFELVKTLRTLKLDVLHTHTPKASVLGRIAGRLAGVPVVVNTCHGLWARPEDSFPKRAFVYGLEALAIRFSDYELFQNAEDAHTMRRFLKRGRWKVVGNGIDLNRFQPDPDGRARVRAEWGVDDDTLVVGTIGRRVREKGLAEFAEAAHRLRDKAVFVWVGPEDNTDAATQVPHQDAIRFVGERTDMPAVYSALDVFVLASYREGFSRASMEAAACGSAMVLTDIRGCREIGSDGEHLLLATAQDAEALTNRIETLLAQPELRTQLGHAAQQRASQEFDQRQVAKESLAAYDRSAPRGTTAGPTKTRPVVLHVLPNDQERGAQVFAGQLRDALAGDAEQQHLVVTLFRSNDAAARADITLGVEPGVFRRVGIDPRALLRLRETIRTHDASVIVAHGGEALKYVVPAADRRPTVYYKVGLSSSEVTRPLHRRLYRFLSNRVTRVVAISQPIREQVRQLFGFDDTKIAVIPNGRDPQKYRPLTPSETAASPPRVLFVGALETGKQPGLFLDVIERLRGTGVAFDAAMVGDGPLRPQLEERADSLDVAMLGTRTDVPELLRHSAVLVMTSAQDTEGMPGVAVEAALSGIPVVSTPSAGIADVVDNGKTGWISDGENTDELADLASRLLTNDDQRQAMGNQARDRALEKFTLSATSNQWHAFISELVGEPRTMQHSSSEAGAQIG